MIQKLKYGNTNTFFIRGTAGGLLLDTDYAGTLPAFYREIKAHDIRLCDISYVLATHYHPDHIGLVSELMQQGVRLLLLDTQKPHIHFADAIFAKDRRLRYVPLSADDAVVITAEESRSFLKTLGIEGCIIPVSSHSPDSIVLLLDSGVCFTGDLEPLSFLGAYEDNPALAADWARVTEHHPRRICHAHANEILLDSSGTG